MQNFNTAGFLRVSVPPWWVLLLVAAYLLAAKFS
jgi:hypothetical protein